MIVREKFRAYRESRGMTRNEMAALLDTSHSLYTRYERGSASIPDQVLSRFSELCGESLEELTAVDEKRLAEAHSFAERLVVFRDAFGLTQTGLARKAGLDFRMIAGYERGSLPPDGLDMYHLLASVLHTQADVLRGISRKDEAPSQPVSDIEPPPEPTEAPQIYVELQLGEEYVSIGELVRKAIEHAGCADIRLYIKLEERAVYYVYTDADTIGRFTF